MALVTYTDLQASVAAWLKRSDLTSAIPDLITLAETEIFRKLRTYEMETAFVGTIAATGYMSLPANYKSWRSQSAVLFV